MNPELKKKHKIKKFKLKLNDSTNEQGVQELLRNTNTNKKKGRRDFFKGGKGFETPAFQEDGLFDFGQELEQFESKKDLFLSKVYTYNIFPFITTVIWNNDSMLSQINSH